MAARHSTRPDSVQRWLAYLRTERGLSPATISSYQYTIETFREYLDGRRPPRQLRHARREDVRGFLGEILQAGTPGGPRSARQRLTALWNFYRMLEMDGVIRKNPTRVDSPQFSRTLPRFLAADQVLLALNCTPRKLRDRAIVELFFASGIRVSELCAARLADLHLGERVLLVHGKGDKERTVPLGGPIVRLLREYIASRHSSSPYIFVSEASSTGLGRRSDRLSRQWVWRLIREWGRVAGLGKVKPHTLRHSCATAMLENGADLRTIQTILGHANVDTTAIYTHTSVKHLRREYEKLERRRAHGQMALTFSAGPDGTPLRLCAQCPNPAAEAKSLCAVHLVLSRKRVKRSRNRQKEKIYANVDATVRLGTETERAGIVQPMPAPPESTIRKPVQPVPQSSPATGTG